MLTKQELNAVITLWKEQYGVQKTSRNGNPYMAVPNSTQDRREALRWLIDTLKDKYNYTKDDFNTVTIERIVDGCTYSDWEEKTRLRKWQDQVENDITIVVSEAFGETIEFIKNERKVVEREVKVAPVYEKPVPKEDSEDYDIDDDEVVELKNPLDKSKLNTGIPASSTVIDEEFLAMLQQGNDDE